MRNFTPVNHAIILFISLTLFGCAGKPWTDPVGEKDRESFETLFYEMHKRDSQCACCLETEITLSWNTPMEKKAMAGHLQIMAPSAIKFIMSNPLGQPLYALVSNGNTFQAVNTVTRKYQRGSFDSLMLRYEAPRPLLSSNWVSFLTGRLQMSNPQITEIRNDREKRGVWVTIHYRDGGREKMNHLLIDPVGKKLVKRVLVEKQVKKGGYEMGGEEAVSSKRNVIEKTVAVINYNNWLSKSNCPVPTNIQITESSFDSELNILLSKITTDAELTSDDFKIKPPPGYFQQFLP